MRFDRTEKADRERTNKKKRRGLQLGEVVKVRSHTTADDTSNFECDVLLYSENQHRRNVPVITNTFGEVAPPKKGTGVIIGFIGEENEKAVILGNLYSIENRAPLGDAGDYSLKRGDKYTELAADGDIARIAKKSADDADPSATLEIDDSGADTLVKVKGEGAPMGLELNLSTGEFKLGDGAGYGIVSDGSGNFTWYEQSLNFVDDGSTINW